MIIDEIGMSFLQRFCRLIKFDRAQGGHHLFVHTARGVEEMLNQNTMQRVRT